MLATGFQEFRQSLGRRKCCPVRPLGYRFMRFRYSNYDIYYHVGHEILTRFPVEVYFLCFASSIGSVAQDAELLGTGVLGSVESPGNHGQESDIDHSQEMGAADGAPYRFCMG